MLCFIALGRLQYSVHSENSLYDPLDTGLGYTKVLQKGVYIRGFGSYGGSYTRHTLFTSVFRAAILMHLKMKPFLGVSEEDAIKLEPLNHLTPRRI